MKLYKILKLLLHNPNQKCWECIFKHDFLDKKDEFHFILEEIIKERPEGAFQFLKRHFESTKDEDLMIDILYAMSIYAQENNEYITNIFKKIANNEDNKHFSTFLNIAANIGFLEFIDIGVSNFKNFDIDKKIAVLRAIAKTKNKKYLRFIQTKIGDKNEKVSLEAIIAIKSFGLISLLFPFARAKNPTIRMLVTGALSDFKPKDSRHIRSLLNTQEILLSDEDDIVKIAAIRSINIGNRKIFEKLFSLFDKMPVFYHKTILGALIRISKKNDELKSFIEKKLRINVVNILLRAIQIIDDNDFLGGLQHMFTFRNDEENYQKILTYLDAKRNKYSSVNILYHFVLSHSQELREIFLKSLEDIIVCKDIRIDKDIYSKYIEYFVELAGKLKIKSLEKDFIILAFSDSSNLSFLSIYALLDMNSQEVSEMLKNDFSNFDEKVKVKLVSAFAKVGSKLLLDEVINDFERVNNKTSYEYLKYLLSAIDKRYLEWVINKVYEEKEDERKYMFLHILYKLDRNKTIEISDRMLQKNISLDLEWKFLKLFHEIGRERVIEIAKNKFMGYKDIELKKKTIKYLISIYDENIYYFILKYSENNQEICDYLYNVLYKMNNLYLKNAIIRIVEERF